MLSWDVQRLISTGTVLCVSWHSLCIIHLMENHTGQKFTHFRGCEPLHPLPVAPGERLPATPDTAPQPELHTGKAASLQCHAQPGSSILPTRHLSRLFQALFFLAFTAGEMCYRQSSQCSGRSWHGCPSEAASCPVPPVWCCWQRPSSCSAAASSL